MDSSSSRSYSESHFARFAPGCIFSPQDFLLFPVNEFVFFFLFLGQDRKGTYTARGPAAVITWILDWDISQPRSPLSSFSWISNRYVIFPLQLQMINGFPIYGRKTSGSRLKLFIHDVSLSLFLIRRKRHCRHISGPEKSTVQRPAGRPMMAINFNENVLGERENKEDFGAQKRVREGTRGETRNAYKNVPSSSADGKRKKDFPPQYFVSVRGIHLLNEPAGRAIMFPKQVRLCK